MAGKAINRFSTLLRFLLIWLPVETNSEVRGQAGTVFRNRAEPWMAEPERYRDVFKACFGIPSLLGHAQNNNNQFGETPWKTAPTTVPATCVKPCVAWPSRSGMAMSPPSRATRTIH
ncbi:hypothetical protein MARINON1_50047 [Marinobacter salarius]|nr:hypothetical protein MBHK15_120048 [Marinobacter salarius]VXB29510.1 hypothetical protein MARINON1_50047 [Marinobacter salarius]